ncbi:MULTISPECIES: hypothetical protein [Kitasatospora]|uniref:DUF1328 domain-containing protein n=1 Tax=Kitasatospora cystarginea TaxID=58350 RepID=A0ABN3EZZ2_9ACTN
MSTVWILVLLLAAVVLGFIGALAKGLFYLLVVAVVVFVAALVLAGARVRRTGRRPTR